MLLPRLVYIRWCLSAISSSKLAVCIFRVTRAAFCSFLLVPGNAVAVSWHSVDGRVGVLSDDDYWPTMSSQLSVSHYYYDYYCRLRWSAVTGSDVYSLNIARPTTKPIGCCCQCCLGCSQHSVGQERGKTHDNQEQKSWVCLYRWWWFGALHVLQLQLSPPPPSSL